jgi:restriction endonuclease S subunit
MNPKNPPKPGYKKTPIGTIPVEWEVSKIGRETRFLSGGTPKKDILEYWDGNIPWYSAKDLKSFFLNDSVDHISKSGSENGTKLVSPGAIFILVRGMMLNRDIPVGIINKESAFNQDIKALLPNKKLDNKFLAYFILNEKRKLLGLVNRSSHGTGKIETSTLKSFPIPLPPPPRAAKNRHHSLHLGSCHRQAGGDHRPAAAAQEGADAAAAESGRLTLAGNLRESGRRCG